VLALAVLGMATGARLGPSARRQHGARLLARLSSTASAGDDAEVLNVVAVVSLGGSLAHWGAERRERVQGKL